MQNVSPAGTLCVDSGSAAALRLDFSSVIQSVATPREARTLPVGTVVGDQHGGLTFTDAVAAALETRSLGGWREIQAPAGETWTIIVLNR